MNNTFCIGIDYGTDSVRALLVDAKDGSQAATSVFEYPRWKKQDFCRVESHLFRQHPLDYVEGLEYTVRRLIDQLPEAAGQVCAISVDTTGSTPVAVNEQGIPLSLLPRFEEDPDAMFILWKDHTSLNEAEQITELFRRQPETDFARYCGGIYSPEWFWAKILHILRHNPRVAAAAYSWVEHCDWMPALLTGNTHPLQMKRCRSAAGHKALWHPEWKGLPADSFLAALHPDLPAVKRRLYSDTCTANVPAGRLSQEWAQRLGLPPSVVVGTGAMDSHFGFVGGQIEPYTFCKVIGTSTVDMLLTPPEHLPRHPLPGICGQVDGSVIPGMISHEAGQSAFGDIYAWFANLLLWPLKNIDPDNSRYALEYIRPHLPAALNEAAEALPVNDSGILSLDWLNGRRSPDADYKLTGAIAGLTLGADAPRIYKSLVEATAFGSRAIFERFKEAGIPIREEIIVMGGVARKSPFILQTLADVMGRPIKLVRSANACALGGAMFAAVAGGIYPDIREAQRHMGSGFDAEYKPHSENVSTYNRLYEKYKQLGSFAEKQLTKN
jgi:L-ribulokinase